jgi:hypothetical protein
MTRLASADEADTTVEQQFPPVETNVGFKISFLRTKRKNIANVIRDLMIRAALMYHFERNLDIALSKRRYSHRGFVNNATSTSFEHIQ